MYLVKHTDGKYKLNHIFRTGLFFFFAYLLTLVVMVLAWL